MIRRWLSALFAPDDSAYLVETMEYARTSPALGPWPFTPEQEAEVLSGLSATHHTPRRRP